MAAAEARNADGASNDMLRIPRPPAPIGRLACSHADSLMSQLVMRESSLRKSKSNSFRAGWSTQYEALITYNKRQLPNAACKIKRASWEDSRCIRVSALSRFTVFGFQNTIHGWASREGSTKKTRVADTLHMELPNNSLISIGPVY